MVIFTKKNGITHGTYAYIIDRKFRYPLFYSIHYNIQDRYLYRLFSHVYIRPRQMTHNNNKNNNINEYTYNNIQYDNNNIVYKCGNNN